MFRASLLLLMIAAGSAAATELAPADAQLLDHYRDLKAACLDASEEAPNTARLVCGRALAALCEVSKRGLVADGKDGAPTPVPPECELGLYDKYK